MENHIAILRDKYISNYLDVIDNWCHASGLMEDLRQIAIAKGLEEESDEWCDFIYGTADTILLQSI